MQPGSSNRYRDSINTSNTYYTNPYRQDCDYRRAEHNRAQAILATDRLESTQERIERELLEKIIAEKGKLADSFILIKNLGKLVFLVAMLPPYIVFYSIPKVIFKKCSEVFKITEPYVNAFFNKFSAMSSLYLKRIYTWPQNKILFISPKLKKNLVDASNRVNQKVIIPFVNFIKRQSSKITQFTTAKITNPIVHGFKRTILVSKRWLGKLKFSFSFPSFSFNLPSIPLTKMRAKWNRLKIKSEELTRSLKKKIQEMSALVTRMIESSWLFLWQPLSQLKNLNYNIPNLGRLKEMYQRVLNTVKQLADTLANRLSWKNNFTIHPFAKVLTHCKEAYNKMSKHAAEMFNKVASKWLNIKKKMAKFFKRDEKFSKKAKERWENFKNNVRSKLLLSKEFTVQKSKAFFALLNSFFKLLGLFFKNFFFSIRILYAVICLFFKYTLQGIKDKIAEEF